MAMRRVMMWCSFAIAVSAACMDDPQSTAVRVGLDEQSRVEVGDNPVQKVLANCPFAAPGTYTSCQSITCPNPLINTTQIGAACRALTPAGNCPQGEAYTGYGAYLDATGGTSCYCGCV